MKRVAPAFAFVFAVAPAVVGNAAGAVAHPIQVAQRAEPRPSPSPQPRAHSTRVHVPPQAVTVDDGDTIVIRWGARDSEIVRVLGIDTPETRHLEHNLPYHQSFGVEAQAFARGAFAGASQIELLRATTVDPYGRTLGYIFLNGRSYSLLVVEARLAYESVSHYGDNGFPREAAAVLEAAKSVGPLAFEPPWDFRNRMRDLSRWMKERGIYPKE
jgi:endonuclease YncB( thermonuclease family)